MKKTRKILSFVLSVLVALGSLPVTYVATAAEDEVLYAATQTGTAVNPTEPIGATGKFSSDDFDGLNTNYKMNINIENTSYTFYQTKDDEYFTFSQFIGLQKKHESDSSDKTLTFEGVSHYEGESSATTVDEKGIGTGTDLMEVPAITTNNTAEFLNKYCATDNVWTAVNSNATELGSEPSNVVLQGSTLDLSGCKVYIWEDTFLIKGLSDSETGEINTSFYDSYKWNWKMNDDSDSASFELRLETEIHILDAREFARELAKAQAVLANPENYTPAYVSSVESTLNSIPDGLKDLSEIYSQSEIDSNTELIKTISLNAADYREYNETYASLKEVTNENGIYNAESFAQFQAKIEEINTNLPKNLDKTQQTTVDAATNALIEAYNGLVINGSAGEDSGNTINVNKTNFTVQNDFKFIQIKDDQKLSFVQKWVIERTGGDTARKFYSDLVTTDADGNAVPFITKLDSSSILTNQTISTKAVKNGLSGVTIFKCWQETDSNGVVNSTSSAIKAEDGVINPDYDGFKDGNKYYLQTTPVFTGLTKDETGEKTYTFDQNVYASYSNWIGIYTYESGSFTTTVTITDARGLVAAVEQAKATLTNPGTHSEEYLVALQAAVDSVPEDLLNGTKYYTQETVDKFISDLTTIPEEVADYSEFVEVFEKMTSLDESNYTEESYNTFIDEIYEINKNLPKNLTADQQATVNAAVDALYTAQDKLVSVHLNEDNVFTQDDIGEDLGNSPIEFSLATTQYNFMQIADGQKFILGTDITVRNTKSNYNLKLRNLGFSVSTPSNPSSVCSTDTHCHGLENITLNQTELVASSVSGVEALTYTDDVVNVDQEGNITHHNTWVNTEGPALATDGLINLVQVSKTKSSAHSEIYYVGASGENSATVDVTYAFWLGWLYAETFIGIEGSTTYRHVHIPVNVKITDARALNALYGEVEDIVNGRLETNYTLASLVNLYNAFKEVPADMAKGETYYSQDSVDAQYAALKAAYDSLAEGADYNEYFEAYIEAQEIINSGNDDGYGNKLYDDATFNSFVAEINGIHNGLDKELTATEENQQTIASATAQIKEAIADIEATKHADYTDFEKALDEAEKILTAPEGTYTDKTIEEIQAIYDNAITLDKNLPASSQDTVDAITSQLESAVADAEFKADYSDYEDALNKVQEIVNNPDKYTSETVKAAEEVMNSAGAIDKDLADTAENRETIGNATDALNNVLSDAREKADYSELEEAKKELDNILNAPEGTYTDETIKNAQDAKDAYDTLDKDLAKSEQATVDAVKDTINSAVSGAQEKANYSDLEEAKKELDNILNAPEGTYTDETIEKAQDAKDAYDALDKDLAKSEQATVDAVKDTISNALSGAQEKADYTDYNNAKATADSLVNEDENGDPIYDEDAFNAYKDAVNSIDSGLSKDLTKDDQSTVDAATGNLESLKNELESKKYYTVTFKDADGNVLTSERYVSGSVFNTISAPAIPENTEDTAYFGWYYENGTVIDVNSAVSGDFNAVIFAEAKKLIPAEDSSITIDGEKDLITGVDAGMSVSEILEKFENDETVVEIKSYTGAILADADLVGSGSTITLKSKFTGEVYESNTFIIMGDVDGDGDIDNDDYQKSVNVGLDLETYTEEHNYFFIANDIDGDGFIDVIDTALIRRMMKK
ncbi:MAG: hypothetical protein ACI4VW_09295 [Acutalibacteraceae bacterium]